MDHLSFRVILAPGGDETCCVCRNNDSLSSNSLDKAPFSKNNFKHNNDDLLTFQTHNRHLVCECTLGKGELVFAVDSAAGGYSSELRHTQCLAKIVYSCKQRHLRCVTKRLADAAVTEYGATALIQGMNDLPLGTCVTVIDALEKIRSDELPGILHSYPSLLNPVPGHCNRKNNGKPQFGVN